MNVETILQAIAPSLYASVTSENLATYVALSKLNVEDGAISNSTLLAEARANLVAHMIVTANKGGESTGALVSEREGDLEKTYSTSSNSSNTNEYYARYEEILRTSVTTFVIWQLKLQKMTSISTSGDLNL